MFFRFNAAPGVPDPAFSRRPAQSKKPASTAFSPRNTRQPSILTRIFGKRNCFWRLPQIRSVNGYNTPPQRMQSPSVDSSGRLRATFGRKFRSRLGSPTSRSQQEHAQTKAVASDFLRQTRLHAYREMGVPGKRYFPKMGRFTGVQPPVRFFPYISESS